MINAQIANPHICKKNSNISDQDSLWSASNIFFTYANRKNIWSANCGRSANLKKLSPKIFGFAIYGSYLWTAYLYQYTGLVHLKLMLKINLHCQQLVYKKHMSSNNLSHRLKHLNLKLRNRFRNFFRPRSIH
jgi:hypothetical protein